MLMKVVWLLCIIIACSANVLPKKVSDESIGDNLDNGVLLHRYRRGWGSLIFTGASILLRTTSLGLVLGAALSDGCIYYKSICTDRDEIKRLDNIIKGMVSQYEQEYVLAKKNFFDLKTATTNNAYISYYINHTIQIVESLQDIEETLVAQLELKLPASSSINNLTFELYLNSVMGQLEYRLADLTQMLAAHKQNALLSIAIHYLVEASVSKFTKSFQNAYNMVSNEDILATTQESLWDRMGNSELEVETKRGTVQKLKLVPKAFKQMAKNFRQNLRDFGASLKKWKRINNWKGFKGKLAHTFRKPIAKLNGVKQFIKNPAVRAKFVKNYKLSWSQGIMTGIGMLGDGIMQYVTVKEWSKVATEMEKARASYQKYHDNLQSNLTQLRKEKDETAQIWKETIDIFKNITLPFKALMINASQNSNFSEVVGLAKLPVDTNSPLFTIDFNKLVQTSLASNQLAVIDFLKDVDNNMTVIEDEMRARLVLYNNTLSKSENNEPVSDIFADVKNILRFSSSQTMKNFGNQLTSKDLVCTVSIVRADISEYDYFSLEPFRPRCEVNSTAFQEFSSEALLQRKSRLMRKIVIKSVNGNTEESLTGLLDAVHNAYLGVSDPNVAAFGSSVTDRDVICIISKEFPSKQTYDFINLVPFRPDCSVVTSTDYSKLTADAMKLRELASGIRNSLKTCKDYLFCPCLTQVASQNQVTVADVEQILNQLDPNWEPNQAASFCGPTGCGCRHL
ncbi:uncharacterized protein LOC127739440 [Mytilus californianus]|uniref:uncharacterized protein LOC127739440 n=1 Tax=Mytilus californianus TaxID=6549 RepID=UPI0022457A5F|nr:uncharacterized protein LOC127739440 [Mytilus californianus]